MPEFEPRYIYLHTLESLLDDLVSGRAVRTSDTETFVLRDEKMRSALQWYRKKGASVWTSSISAAVAEELVDATLLNPPEVQSLITTSSNTKPPRIRLKKLEVHRFAGLHKFGTPTTAPENYTHDFISPLTLFQGRNGSGKTSLLNAIIWALTGEVL